MTQDDNQDMSGRERAMDGLLKELARAGTGPDMAFVSRVMSHVQSRPGLASKGTWIQRASRWPGTWMILGVLVAVSLLVISKKPEPKQFQLSEASAKIEAKSDIGTVPVKKDETLLYSATFSPELSEWVDFTAVQVDRTPILPDGTQDILRSNVKKPNGTVLRAVDSSIGDKKIRGVTIDCKDLKKDGIAIIILNNGFDEDHIEIEFDVRVREFYSSKNSSWGFLGVGLHRDINAPPAKHYTRLKKQAELIAHLEKMNWSHYRATLRRSVSKDGVVGTDIQQFYDNVLYTDNRIEMTSNRILIGQLGICTEITNFRVHRIGPPKTNAPDEGF